LKIAVIGVGRWGRNHVRVVHNLIMMNKCESLTICDVNKSLVRRVSREYGIDEYYYSIDDLINKSHVDAAIVAVPTVFHHKVCKRILPHMDVLVEKPLATNLEEARELVDLAKRMNRLLVVGHIERYNQAVIAVKELIKELRKEGERPTYIVAQRVGPGPQRDYVLNLGVAHDLMIHDIDVVNFLLEERPHEVQAITVRVEDFPYEIEIIAIYTYKKGAIANLRASWRARPNFKDRTLSIYLRGTLINLDYIYQSYTVERGLIEQRASGSYEHIVLSYRAREELRRTLPPLALKEPLFLEVDNFISALRGEKAYIVTGEEGLNALRCVVYALKSAEKGRRLKIVWD